MDGCIEFTGSFTRSGYGRKYVRGSFSEGKVRYMPAHRWAWEQVNGPVPEGMIVMHLCDNRACMNVDHLRIGTQQDNIRDMIAKGRGPKQQITHCPQGHEYTEENTYRPKRRSGYERQCRTCIHEQSKRRWAAEVAKRKAVT